MHQFRARNYAAAVRKVQAVGYELRPGDGTRIMGNEGSIGKKIDEILTSGTSRRAAALRSDPKNGVMKQFIDIWGVGETTANQLYGQGYTSLEKLRNTLVTSRCPLTETQIKGLEWHDDLVVRIPRAEMTEIQQSLLRLAKDVLRTLPMDRRDGGRQGSPGASSSADYSQEKQSGVGRGLKAVRCYDPERVRFECVGRCVNGCPCCLNGCFCCLNGCVCLLNGCVCFAQRLLLTSASSALAATAAARPAAATVICSLATRTLSLRR